MLGEKRKEIANQANKLRNGLWKIDDCKEKVQTMSVELEDAQVKVAEFQQQCDDYLIIIVAQKKEADEQQVNKISIFFYSRPFNLVSLCILVSILRMFMVAEMRFSVNTFFI